MQRTTYASSSNEHTPFHLKQSALTRKRTQTSLLLSRIVEDGQSRRRVQPFPRSSSHQLPRFPASPSPTAARFVILPLAPGPSALCSSLSFLYLLLFPKRPRTPSRTSILPSTRSPTLRLFDQRAVLLPLRLLWTTSTGHLRAPPVGQKEREERRCSNDRSETWMRRVCEDLPQEIRRPGG